MYHVRVSPEDAPVHLSDAEETPQVQSLDAYYGRMLVKIRIWSIDEQHLFL